MASARTRRGVLSGTVAVILVLVIIIASGGVLSGIKAAGRAVVAPFAWVLTEVTRPIGNAFAGAFNYSDVVAQNRQLRAELGRAQMQGNESSAMLQQLEEVTTLQNLPFVGSIRVVTAQVTTNSPTNFSASFTIARGTDDGLLAGMPVVGNGGLIGRVVAVSAHSATVLMITDATAITGATFGNGHTDVLINGRGVDENVVATAVPLSSPITPGTVFTTSGLSGGLYPPGIPVATVQTVLLTPGASTYDFSLTPTADLHHLGYVDVMLWEPGT